MSVLTKKIISSTEPPTAEKIDSTTRTKDDEEAILNCFKETKDHPLNDIIKESSDLCYEMTNEIHSKLRMDWPDMTALFSMIKQKDPSASPLTLFIDGVCKLKKEYQSLLQQTDNSILHFETQFTSITSRIKEESSKKMLQEFHLHIDNLNYIISEANCKLDPILKLEIIIKILHPIKAISHLLEDDDTEHKEDLDCIIKEIESLFYDHLSDSQLPLSTLLALSLPLIDLGISKIPITILRKKHTDSFVQKLKNDTIPSLKKEILSSSSPSLLFITIDEWFHMNIFTPLQELSVEYEKLGNHFIEDVIAKPIFQLLQKGLLPHLTSLANLDTFCCSYNILLKFHQKTQNNGNISLLNILSSFQITPYYQRRVKSCMNKISLLKEEISCMINVEQCNSRMDLFAKRIINIIKEDGLSVGNVIPIGYEGKFVRLLIVCISSLSEFLINSIKHHSTLTLHGNPTSTIENACTNTMIIVSKDHLELLFIYTHIVEEDETIAKNEAFVKITKRFTNTLLERQKMIADSIYDSVCDNPVMLKWICQQEFGDDRIAPMDRLSSLLGSVMGSLKVSPSADPNPSSESQQSLSSPSLLQQSDLL